MVLSADDAAGTTGTAPNGASALPQPAKITAKTAIEAADESIRIHLLDPLRAPSRRSNRFPEVLRFVEYFVSSKLVDIHRIPRLSVVHDNDLAYPNRAAAHYPPYFRYGRMIWVCGSLSDQVRAAAYSFARLREVTNDVFLVEVARNGFLPALLDHRDPNSGFVHKAHLNGAFYHELGYAVQNVSVAKRRRGTERI